MQVMKHRAFALFAIVAIAACSGDKGQQGDPGTKGDPGAPGATGATGATGANGVSTGGVEGTLTYKVAGVVYNATNVNVTSVPVCDVGEGDVLKSDAQGYFHLGSGCPIGVYTVTFTSPDFATKTVTNVSIVAGKRTQLSLELTPVNPLGVKASASIPNPAGFGTQVTLSVDVTGGTAPYTFVWNPKYNATYSYFTTPTDVTASIAGGTKVQSQVSYKDSNGVTQKKTIDAWKADDTAHGTLQFTTGNVADVVAYFKANGLYLNNNDGTVHAGRLLSNFGPSLTEDATPVPFRDELLTVSAQSLAEMTYNFDVVVTDSVGFSKTLTVAVAPATLAQGTGSGAQPQGTLIIGSFPENAGTISFAGPSGVTANGLNTKFPWFVASAEGDYDLGGLKVTAAKFVSSNPNCGGCHSYTALLPDQGANVQAKFKKWANSAHGNHFFKFFDYDDQGNLVAKNPNAKLPTAVATIFWDIGTVTPPMTTFQFGMEGAEGSHYSASCTGCHTTGYNLALNNNGADDVMAAAGWTFPDLGVAFKNNLYPDAAGATPAPDDTVWKNIPATVKAYAGMQCESCHGPLGKHVYSGANKPQAEYDVAACAICHDRPTNHDRVNLWRQSAHANVGLAAAELRTSCARCHNAQGYVLWNKQQQAQTLVDGSGNLLSPGTSKTAAGVEIPIEQIVTEDTVQPITCAACHDSHSTTVRVSGDTKMLPAGFSVMGAGSGALCMTCHNSRNGARGDAFNGVYFNWGSAVTSIGAPHEANQTDVYAGQNAFFYNAAIGKPNGHLAVAETCVGCHMKLIPDGQRATNTNHVFNANTSICKHCHGEEVNGEALVVKFEDTHAKLFKLISDKAFAALPDPFFIKGSTNTVQVAKANVDLTKTVFVTGRSPGWNMFFTTAITDPNAATGTVTSIVGGEGAGVGYDAIYTTSGATTRVFNRLTGLLAKANWNYVLVDDGSNSLHNPNFVFQVMDATTAALNAGGTW